MRVAVYGSLRQGYGNHRLLEDSKYLGNGITEGRYTMMHLGGFPGVIENGNTSIVVEMYDVDDDTARDLDRLEGHPSFYERKQINVLPTNTADEAKWEPAWMYLLPQKWNDGRCPVVESGDWTKRSMRNA